jgi:hypothetical protein
MYRTRSQSKGPTGDGKSAQLLAELKRRQGKDNKTLCFLHYGCGSCHLG